MLQHSGLKIGCIVNDVAAVNIDAKLIRADQNRADPSSTTDLADTIELANGCACTWSGGVDRVGCLDYRVGGVYRVRVFVLRFVYLSVCDIALAAGCSIADELMLSFANLIELSDRRETPYDRYNGVALMTRGGVVLELLIVPLTTVPTHSHATHTHI